MQTVTPAKNYQVLFDVHPVDPNAEVFSDVVDMGQVNQAALYISLVMGNMVHFSFEIQGSYDGVNFNTKTVLDLANGTPIAGYYFFPAQRMLHRMLGDGDIVVDIPSCYQYMRIGIQGNGDPTGSSVTMAIGSGSI